jgi:hypothetical protein
LHQACDNLEKSLAARPELLATAEPKVAAPAVRVGARQPEPVR